METLSQSLVSKHSARDPIRKRASCTRVDCRWSRERIWCVRVYESVVNQFLCSYTQMPRNLHHTSSSFSANKSGHRNGQTRARLCFGGMCDMEEAPSSHGKENFPERRNDTRGEEESLRAVAGARGGKFFLKKKQHTRLYWDLGHTGLTYPMTKMYVHLGLALHGQKPVSIACGLLSCHC